MIRFSCDLVAFCTLDITIEKTDRIIEMKTPSQKSKTNDFDYSNVHGMAIINSLRRYNLPVCSLVRNKREHTKDGDIMLIPMLLVCFPCNRH
jgi:hypothetical protein